MTKSFEPKVVTIGREADNDIVLPGGRVSRHHALLRENPDGTWELQDLGSANGTYCGGNPKRITRQTVGPDETFWIADVPVQVAQALRPCASAPGAAQGPAAAVEGRRTLDIGRAQGNDLVLENAQVSRTHAQLYPLASGGWAIRDLGSTNGIFRNTMANRVQEAVLCPGDTIFFGSWPVPADFLLDAATAQTTQAPPVQIKAGNEPLILGRSAPADIIFDHPTVSRRHARITPRERGSWIIEDLGSTNGTYVNGQRLVFAQAICETDDIALGSYCFQLTADRQIVTEDYSTNLRLDACGIAKVVSDRGRPRHILHDISFTAYAKEFVGLMGLSGAGKTTLFRALNGYDLPTAGQVLLNGKDLYANYAQFKALIGYVPQEDVLHKELTVGEALRYAARLRLPQDTSEQEIDSRVNSILGKLGLYAPERNIDTRGTIIGSSEKKGISGGQKKRVNLAMELLTDPGVLFLDEPTSGLSAVDTQSVMRLLRSLADEGKTIILTIHQPDIQSYKLMDNILILHHGRQVYYGPSWPDSIRFFAPGCGEEDLSRPECALLGVDSDSPEAWAARYALSPLHTRFVEGRAATLRPAPQQEPQPAQAERSRRFDTAQFWTLCRRNVSIKLKDMANTLILLLQAPVIAGLIAMLFHDSKVFTPLPLFLMAISSIWLGSSNAIREIVSEKAIYFRERMVFLRIPEYVLSKFAVLALLCAGQCAMLVCGLTMADVRADWFALFLVGFLVSLVGLGLGLLASSLAPTQMAAISLLPLIVLPMVILGGGMVSLPRMPEPVRALSNVMPTRWGYEALLHLEDAGRNTGDEDRTLLRQTDMGRLGEAAPPNTWIRHEFGDHAHSLGLCVFVLFLNMGLLLTGTVVALKWRDTIKI